MEKPFATSVAALRFVWRVAGRAPRRRQTAQAEMLAQNPPGVSQADVTWPVATSSIVEMQSENPVPRQSVPELHGRLQATNIPSPQTSDAWTRVTQKLQTLPQVRAQADGSGLV
jgi:hypothetical protein